LQPIHLISKMGVFIVPLWSDKNYLHGCKLSKADVVFYFMSLSLFHLNSLIGFYKNGSTVSIMTFIKYATLGIMAIGTNAECRN
jgi:hypothetical protein